MKQIFLKLIFVITLIHFLKDITQDILQIPTILDFFGNIQEDFTKFSPPLAHIIIIFGYLSFLGEVVILTLIPAVLKNNFQNRTNNLILLTTGIILVLYFLLVSLLDPSVRFVLRLLFGL